MYVYILRAKVYTKSVFNKEFCNFIPALLRTQSSKQVIETLGCVKCCPRLYLIFTLSGAHYFLKQVYNILVLSLWSNS